MDSWICTYLNMGTRIRFSLNILEAIVNVKCWPWESSIGVQSEDWILCFETQCPTFNFIFEHRELMHRIGKWDF